MLYEIPFDPEILKQQMKLRYKLLFKKKLNRNKINLILSIFIVLMGWDMAAWGRIYGYLFLGAGLILCLNTLNYFWHYRKTVMKGSQLVKDMTEEHNNSAQPVIWEFTEDFFRYKDVYYEHIIKWPACKGYSIIERNLFLHMDTSMANAYIIGESEIGSESFKNVVDLVITKTRSMKEPRAKKM